MEVRNKKIIVSVIAGVFLFSIVGGLVLLYQNRGSKVVEKPAQSEEERIKNEMVEKTVKERESEFLKNKVNECISNFQEEDWDLTLLQGDIGHVFYVKNILPIIDNGNQESCTNFNKWQTISDSFTEERCNEDVNTVAALNLLASENIDEFSTMCREKVAINDNKDETEALDVICDSIKDSFLQKKVIFDKRMCDEIVEDVDTCEYELEKSCNSGVCSIIKYAVAIAKKDISFCSNIVNSKYKAYCQFYFDKVMVLSENKKDFEQEYCVAKINQKISEYTEELRNKIKEEIKNTQ